MEKTLIIIKPDGVERGMVGEIISRFERRGFRIGALKMVKVDRTLAEQHYAVHRGKFFYDDLVKYISSSPVIVAVLEGPDVIKATRLMVGATRPAEAVPGTIRGDLAVSTLRNLIHASDGIETAKQEIALWFTKGGVLDYQRDIDSWIYEAD